MNRLSKIRICYASSLQGIRRSFNTGNGNSPEYKSMKLKKRLFSTILFGGTLITAIILNKKRKSKQQELFKGCVFLPKDVNYAPKFYFCKYKDYVFPSILMKNLREAQTLKARPDDILVASFPKTGTTWVQEIVYLICTDLDFKSVELKNLEQRFPFLEYFYPGLSSLEKMTTSPRFVKTHLPYPLLPETVYSEKPKIIYVIRNPKDVCVSLYHFTRMIKETGYSGSFHDFFDSFLKGNVSYGPIWKHYLDWWSHRNDDNILIISYEDLHKDIHGCICRIAEFLGKNLSTSDIQRIAQHCSFQEMSRNPSCNYEHWKNIGLVRDKNEHFMRKGEVGDWRNHFTNEMDSQMNAWIEEHFSESGLKFVFSL